jgi:hypothetical protein
VLVLIGFAIIFATALVQGYLLGRPAPPWPSVDIPAAAPAISLHTAQA